MDSRQSPSTELATLAGGCFWCIEAVFAELRGVVRVESGYSGGHVANPTYRQVCGGDTGHAEVVQISFDPHVISFRELLEVFFSVHDPTTLNRQGADVGPQYRSAIFYHSEDQRRIAEEIIRDLTASARWSAPIVTELSPFQAFFKAEDYHQDYFRLHGEQPYCRIVIAPKMAKFRKEYRERLLAR